jgi:biotin operon repressor
MSSAEKKTFTSNKLDFMDAISKDTRITATAFRVAYRLLQRFKEKRGSFPSQALVASEIGCSERAVREAIADLVDVGWLHIVRHGRRNFYGFKWVKQEGRDVPTKRQQRNANAVNRDRQNSAGVATPDRQNSAYGGNRHRQNSAYVSYNTYDPSESNTSVPSDSNTYGHMHGVHADRVGRGSEGQGTTKNPTMGFRDIMRSIGMSEPTLDTLCGNLRSVRRRLTPGLGWRLRNDLLMMRNDYGVSFESCIDTMACLGWDVIADPDSLAAHAVDISEAA